MCDCDKEVPARFLMAFTFGKGGHDISIKKQENWTAMVVLEGAQRVRFSERGWDAWAMTFRNIDVARQKGFGV